MTWMQGALRREITKHTTKIVGPDRLIFHTAVTNAQSLYNYFSGVSDCSTWYVAEDGTIEQYVSTDYQAPAQRDGNYNCLSVESWDGYKRDWFDGDAVPPWTPKQMESNAQIAAWCFLAHDIPLELIPDSKPGRRGIGYHRLGVDPWRVDGGELWSKNVGKLCPGDNRIKQLPAIVERAKELTMGLSSSEVARLQAFLQGIADFNAAEEPDTNEYGIGRYVASTIRLNANDDASIAALAARITALEQAPGGTVDATLRERFKEHKHAEGTTAAPRASDIEGL